MGKAKLMKVSYYDSKAEVRLTTYADTVVYDPKGNIIVAIRFGGYPEQVKAMADAMFGGGGFDIETEESRSRRMYSLSKQYQRKISHDGIYAEATLLVKDDELTAANADQEEIDKPKKTFIFCEQNNSKALFVELDHKTAVPLIPEFQDYFLDELKKRGILKQLRVISLREKFDAWLLECPQNDDALIDIISAGLTSGAISIPGGSVTLHPMSAAAGTGAFDEITTVSQYLNRFGITVANRIKSLFQPLFDPATEQLSQEVLAVNAYFHKQTKLTLYDAQLAVAESVKRRLDCENVALIIAECGSGKTKIGSAGLHAHQQGKRPGCKTFNVVLCPSHVTRKWVREIEEALPNTFTGVIDSPAALERFYAAYQRDNKTAYVVMSKEKARDGYMKQPAAIWSSRKKAFICPDCGGIIEMEFSDDGSKYRVNADQFYFIRETDKNHKCEFCRTPLWTALNPGHASAWVKIGNYGFVYRHKASEHLTVCKNPEAYDLITRIAAEPDGYYPAAGAYRRMALSTYIRHCLKGKLDGLILDELHQYSNQSGQGDAMAELVGVAKKTVGMTATLINGYSAGIFYLLFRMAPELMLKDGRDFKNPRDFNQEYGVIESVYELKQAEYNANRRASKRKLRERQLPGVSPLVYSRFLMESAAFLSLQDMGKQLPEYEEIPVALNMRPDVATEYARIEDDLKSILKNEPEISKKILSSYLGILTVYPDQPYGHDPILHPISKEVLVQPRDTSHPDELHEKDMKLLEIVQAKIAKRERVLIYTSWVRIDTQDKLKKLLAKHGIKADVLSATVSPNKREAWVEKRVGDGLQVLITNGALVETGLDLNDFTTLIYYNISYNLFSLRQSSRRSWRINQTAPRIEVYMFYYRETMQHRAMRLMASKLAVASIIEGNLSDEGLAAMSECSDMTTLLAKELTLGIKNEVEDIAEAFRKMAILRPVSEATAETVEKNLLPAIDADVLTVKTIEPQKQADIEPLFFSVPPRSKKKEIVPEYDGQLSFFDFLAA